MTASNEKTCVECKRNFNNDHEWEKNCENEPVCSECASQMAKYHVSKMKPRPSDDYMFYAQICWCVGNDSETFETRYFAEPQQAIDRAVYICRLIMRDAGYKPILEVVE